MPMNAGFWRICYPTALNIGICNAETLSFSLAQRKELKETFTPPRPPLQGRMQTRDLGRPKSLLFFGRPGLRPLLLNRGYSPLKPSLPPPTFSGGLGVLLRQRERSEQRKNMANPEGAKAGEPYQNFDGEGCPSESTTSPPSREGLGEGGCFF